MRLSSRLRTILVCSMLEFAALVGMPMRAEQIQELMRTMNRPTIAHVVPAEDEHGDGEPPPS